MLYRDISVIAGSLVGLVGFLLVTLRTPIFVIWLGTDQPGAHGFLALLVFAATSAIMFAGAGVALAKGIGRPGLETAYALVTLTIVIVSKPILIRAIGPIGSVASSTLSWCIGAVVFLILLHRSVSLPKDTVTRTVGLFAVTLLLSIAGWWGTTNFLFAPSNRLEAGLVIVVMGAVLTTFYSAVLLATRIIQVGDFRNVRIKPLQQIFRGKARHEIRCPDIAA